MDSIRLSSTCRQAGAPGKLRGLCGLTLLLSLSIGCLQEPSLDGASRAISDPQLVRFDADMPSYRFEGDGGSLLVGRGWEVPEGDGSGDGPWGGYAWATQGPSELFFRRPAHSDAAPSGLVFYAVCTPLPFEDAPEQSVTLHLNGHRVGELALAPGWQQVRLPLPAASLVDGINRLELEFAYARRPAEVLGTADRRMLSVAFTEIAIGPADKLEGDVVRSTDLSAGRLSMVVGSVVDVPLPPRHDGRVRLPAMNGECEDCLLTISRLAHDGGVEQLWRGRPAHASGGEVAIATSERGIDQLRFELSQEVGASGRVEFFLTPHLLDLRRRPSSENVAGKKAPNVFVYLIDTLRADELAPYGAAIGRSPAIARFSRDSVVYLEARTSSSWTLPAVASLLTGKHAREHGVMDGKRRLAEDEITLPGWLAELGYDSVGISQSYVVGPHFGLDRGFESFILNNQLAGRNLRSQRIRRYLTEWLLAEPRERPIFAYLHTVDPHGPYTPPPGYRALSEANPGSLPREHYGTRVFMTQGIGEDPAEVAHLRALYSDEVGYADEQFGRFVDLLRHLDLYDDSLIVLLSDHGEEFGEHGGFDHGRTLYDELLRVPLIVKYPQGRWAGTRVENPVSVLDVLPTVLLEGGITPPGADGRALQVDRLSNDERSIVAEVAPQPAEHLAAVDLRSLVRGRGKCIQSRNGIDQFGRPIPEWQVFDLQRDPREAMPFESDNRLSEGCRASMNAWSEELVSRPAGGQSEVSQETLEQLRALGYIR